MANWILIDYHRYFFIGQLPKCTVGRFHPGHPSQIPQLDPPGLHLRDEADHHIDIQVLECPHVQKCHPQMSDGNW